MTALNFPDSPSNGDTYQGYTYNSTKGTWAKPDDPDARTAVYANIAALPTSGTAGDMAYVTATNRLYLWTGTGWYNIALINNNPTISGVNSSYALAVDGTATTVTITATDPEGLPITYSLVSDTSGNTATVVQGTGATTNVFTITPSTNTANAGTFSLTFQASDGVNIASAAASFTLQFKVQNQNYTTALITSVGADNAVNNSFDDKSASNHTITANGDAKQTTFSPYRHGGYSNYFDGSGDYLTVADHADLSMGTGDFTIEMWVYPTTSNNGQSLITKGSNSTYTPYLFMLYGTDLRFLSSSNGSSYDIANKSVGTVTINAWNHIAMVKSGTSYTTYVNGTQSDTFTSSSNPHTNTQAVGIGGANNGTELFAGGYITDVRIIKGTAVTPSSGGPTERLTAITNTTLLTCHLPYIADGSTTGHAITVTGNTSTRPFVPYDDQEYAAGSHGGSIYFDGSSRLEAADSADWNQDTDFTMEAWFYPTSIPAQYVHMFGQWQSGGGGNRNTQLTLDPNGRLFMTVNRSGTNYSTPVGTTLKINNWYHVAVTLSGTTLTVWINGENDGSTTVGGSANDSAMGWAIGAEPGSGSYPFTGNIAETRVIKGTALYTTAFTPPTAPLTAIANTKLLLSGTDAGIIDKSQTSSVLVLDGDTKCSSTQTKYRSTAIYTDGTGDRVRFGINNKKLVCDWGVGGEPFTVEWWMYDTQPYTAQHSFGPQTGGGAGAWNSSTGHQWITYWNSNVLNIYYYGTNGSYNGNTCTAAQLGIVQNQWQHVAHTYDGTTWRLYVDGVHGFHWVLPNQPASVSGTFAALGAFAETAYYTAAYYDDVRITKGLARYTGTSSFTPPAAALKG